MRRLRFWVQKVLPLVYDDSLSYYELLSKVVAKLNEVITNYDELAKEVSNLYNLNITDAVEEILTGWLNDGTLEDILNVTLTHSDYVQIDSIYTVNADSSNTIYGDCFLITGTVNGIIDFGHEATVYALRQKLTELNVTKLDFVVISHYHLDHVTNNFAGALSNLIGHGIDFSECTFYLPHKGVDYSQWTGTGDNPQARELAVKSALTANGITWVEPSNDQEVQLSTGIKLRFSNIGDYSTYYSYTVDSRNNPLDHTNYNSFSMVTELLVYERNCLFTGDIDYPANEKLAGKYHNVEVYKIEHHALEATCPREWLNSFSPKVVLLNVYNATYANYPQYLQRPCLVAKANQGAEILLSSLGASVRVGYEGATVLGGAGFSRNLIGEPIAQGMYYNDDLNDSKFRSPGYYLCEDGDMCATLSNSPYHTGGFLLETKRVNSYTGGGRMQFLYPNSQVLTGYWWRRGNQDGYQEWRYASSREFEDDQP